MQSDIKVISGSAHPRLSESICDVLHVEPCKATLDTFPDGETFVKINENIRGRDVFLVQPTCSPTNQNLMELLIMVDAAKRASAERITAVMPFYGYARQDRKDQPRVPITAKLVANLLVAAGVNRVLTMDLHAGQIQGFFDIPVDNLYASPIMVRYLQEKGMDDLVVVSPDVGGLKRAHGMANDLDADLAIVAKHRVSATEVEAMNLIGEVEGRDVILVDDMTETAGTLVAAATMLQKNGAKRIFAGVSHAVLGDIGRQRLLESPIEELITTDSVPMAQGEKIVTLSIAKMMADAIHRTHHGESVTSLFDIRA